MRCSPSQASTPSLRSQNATPDNVDFGGNVRVVVRVRGFLPRETERGAKCLVAMDPDSQVTTLSAPNHTDPANVRSKNRRVEGKVFTFDQSFWSYDVRDKHYANQETIYQVLGEELLDANFQGYNTCIFAYGQTGSGKSYTMMGTPEDPGLIPRTCVDLFERIESCTYPNLSHHVRVSYWEIYNEHIRDLLVEPSEGEKFLQVKEHPVDGPFVKDLKEVTVKSLDEIMHCMRVGDSHRTTASTKMNDTSSRSHAVFTIMMKQICHDMETDQTTERTARIRLVDLAGSERAKATGAQGARLREGANINKSLSTLGRVIAALADPKRNRFAKNKKARVEAPFRDSALTFLLKDSLSGNSKTAMIACIAPSDYDETLSTLRYADQAKNIRTKAKVNEDSKSKAERERLIAEMEERIRKLELDHTYSDLELQRKTRERMEQYQAEVQMLNRMHADSSAVMENKMQAIMAQNDALKLHLKLAVEAIKNPIVFHPSNNLPLSDEEIEEMLMAKEGPVLVEDTPDIHDSPEYVSKCYERWTEYDPNEEEREEKEKDMHYYLSQLMQETQLFKQKLRDDRARFDPESFSVTPASSSDGNSGDYDGEGDLELEAIEQEHIEQLNA